jgi:hypothetical protein
MQEVTSMCPASKQPSAIPNSGKAAWIAEAIRS